MNSSGCPQSCTIMSLIGIFCVCVCVCLVGVSAQVVYKWTVKLIKMLCAHVCVIEHFCSHINFVVCLFDVQKVLIWLHMNVLKEEDGCRKINKWIKIITIYVNWTFGREKPGGLRWVKHHPTGWTGRNYSGSHWHSFKKTDSLHHNLQTNSFFF